MPFRIVRNDITQMEVDAIVNTVSPEPGVGYGVDTGIHLKAGPGLLEARKKLGKIKVGNAGITPGFDLPARYVIHTAGPVWSNGSCGEEKLLKSCYEKCLKLAKLQGCSSIAFPLISAGNHGFPKPLALQTAMAAISDFLMCNDMEVILVVYSRGAFQLSEKLFRDVTSFIDENYVQQQNYLQYGVENKCSVRQLQQQMTLREQMCAMEAVEACRKEEDMPDWDAAPCAPMASSCAMEEATPDRGKVPKKGSVLPFFKPKPSLAELLRQTDAGFSETLLTLIDRTGKKDAEIYTKANVSRQHFSKIRNNPGYKPTKATAIAFAIALELDLEQTRDLIGRAGYALTNSSKFDVIIMYFISEGNYNMYDINAALFEFDQSLLGA